MADTQIIDEQTRQILAQLPPAGLAELAQYLEFLAFKYGLLQASPTPPVNIKTSKESLTAHYQGFVQSPLTVAELGAAYELSLVDQLCGAWAGDNSIVPIFQEIEQQRILNKPCEVHFDAIS